MVNKRLSATLQTWRVEVHIVRVGIAFFAFLKKNDLFRLSRRPFIAYGKRDDGSLTEENKRALVYPYASVIRRCVKQSAHITIAAMFLLQ